MPTPLDIARKAYPPRPTPAVPGADGPFRRRFEYGIRHSDLPTTARLVALVLATWADYETGVIPAQDQPGVATIAKATGLGVATVRACLMTLQAGAWCERMPAPPGSGTSASARTTLTIPQGRPNPR